MCDPEGGYVGEGVYRFDARMWVDGVGCVVPRAALLVCGPGRRRGKGVNRGGRWKEERRELGWPGSRIREGRG